jgi:hypothetical protein
MGTGPSGATIVPAFIFLLGDTPARLLLLYKFLNEIVRWKFESIN